MEKLDNELWQIIEELGIEKNRVEIDHTDSRKLDYRRNKSEIIRKKNYWIKFQEIGELDEFASKVEDIKITKSGIVKVNYSKMEKLEIELKIEAIKNAKSKAEEILEAKGEKLGKVKLITELYENDYRNYLLNQYLNFQKYSMRVHNGMLSPNSGSEVKYKKVRLRTTIKATFEIQ